MRVTGLERQAARLPSAPPGLHHCVPKCKGGAKAAADKHSGDCGLNQSQLYLTWLLSVDVLLSPTLPLVLTDDTRVT